MYVSTLHTLLSSLSSEETAHVSEVLRDNMSSAMEMYPHINPVNTNDFYRSYLLGFLNMAINYANTSYIDTVIGIETLLCEVDGFTDEDFVTSPYVSGLDDGNTDDHVNMAYCLAETMAEAIRSPGDLWGVWETLSSQVSYGRSTAALRFESADISSTDSLITAMPMRATSYQF